MAGVRTVVLGVLVALLLTPLGAAARADSPAATKRVVRSWSARLNTYDNEGAARLFARPAVFEQGGTALRLRDYLDIVLWHSLLPCAGQIVSITVTGDRATAVFVLANGRGRRCGAAGQKAAAVFRVRNGKIVRWTQIPVPAPKGPTA